MKKLFVSVVFSAVSFGALVAHSGMKLKDSELFAPRRNSGNRSFGLTAATSTGLFYGGGILYHFK